MVPGGGGGWRRYARARSVYYSKLLSATTVPPAIEAAAWPAQAAGHPHQRSPTRWRHAHPHSRVSRPRHRRRRSARASTVPSGTPSTLCRVLCAVRRSCTPSPYARDTLHLCAAVTSRYSSTVLSLRPVPVGYRCASVVFAGK